MIRVVLRGGLGNQMFQYAAGLNLAIKNETKLVLDTVFLNDRMPRKEFTFRTYDLDIFEVESNFSALAKISDAVPIPGVWLGVDLVLMEVEQALGVRKIFKEKKESIFDPEFLRIRGDVTLWGHWQTERYFSDIRDVIKDNFRFRVALEGEAKELAEKITSCNAISLHIRRGDYVAFKGVAKEMGVTSFSYYQKAAAYISERVSSPHFFVFSDDIEWCKKNMHFPFLTTYVSQTSSGPKAGYHLELISLCKHNIIANSTFSWWGAWLNRNSEKIVIAPKEWARGKPAEHYEIIPNGWKLI